MHKGFFRGGAKAHSAGTRLNIATYATRSYSLETTPGAEGDEWRWNYQRSGTTMGEMNTLEAAELWGECPFTVSDDFSSATAEALSEYFDKHLPADFLARVVYNDAESITAVTVDKIPLTLGTGYTVGEKNAEGAVVVTLKADALTALDLAVGGGHKVVFTMNKGLAPEVELVVRDSGASGDRSTSITPSITDFRVEGNTATITLLFTNDDEGKTADGWKWTILSSPDVGFSNVTTNTWHTLSDSDIGVEVPEELPVPANADAQFYKAVTTDEP